CGSPPTMSGARRSSGFSSSSTAAKKASRSRWATITPRKLVLRQVEPEPRGRPVAGDHRPDQARAGNRSPDARVARVAPVVAEEEVVAGGDVPRRASMRVRLQRSSRDVRLSEAAAVEPDEAACVLV